MITINPKEYLEHFEDFSANKKHKGQKKGIAGMDFENFASRIATSRQIDNFVVPKNEYTNQCCFTVVVGEM